MGKKKNKIMKKILKDISIHNIETGRILRKISHKQDEESEDRLDVKLRGLEYNSFTKTKKFKIWFGRQTKDLRFWLLIAVVLFNLWKFGTIDFNTMQMILENWAMS